MHRACLWRAGHHEVRRHGEVAHCEWHGVSYSANRASRGLLPGYAVSSLCKAVTTFASVAAFTFFPFNTVRIVFRSSPVCFVVFRNPRSLISAIKLSFATTRPASPRLIYFTELYLICAMQFQKTLITAHEIYALSYWDFIESHKRSFGKQFAIRCK